MRYKKFRLENKHKFGIGGFLKKYKKTRLSRGYFDIDLEDINYNINPEKSYTIKIEIASIQKKDPNFIQYDDIWLDYD